MIMPANKGNTIEIRLKHMIPISTNPIKSITHNNLMRSHVALIPRTSNFHIAQRNKIQKKTANI